MDTEPLSEEFLGPIADDWEFHVGVGLWYFGSKTTAKYMKFMELHVYQEEDLTWHFNIHGVSDEDKHSYIHLDATTVKTQQDFLDLCRLLNVGKKL